MLATADAHGLYRKVGFTELSKPERIMEKLLPDAYCSGGVAEGAEADFQVRRKPHG